MRRYWKALYLDGFSDAAVTSTVDWSNRGGRHARHRPPLRRGDVRVGAAETAFGDRSSESMLGIDFDVARTPRPTTRTSAYTRAFWGAMQPLSDGKTYFNFPGLLEEGDAAVRDSYGANHARLARIKAAYDPDNRFPAPTEENIRPAA